MQRLLPLTVRELMTTEPLCTTREASLLEALRVMKEHAVTCLIVTREPGQGFGVLTHKDAMSMLTSGAGDLEDALSSTLVGDVMSSPAVTVPPDYTVDTALDLMRMLGVRRAPVVEAGQLLGVISFTDIFRRALEELV